MNKKISSINSMTGFARHQHQDPCGIYIWEIKTLNHRFSDICIVIPTFTRDLELKLRKQISSKITRGKVDAQLKFIPNNAQFTNISVNENVVNSIKDVLQVIQNKFENIAPVSLDSILNYPGVIVSDDNHSEILEQSIVESLRMTLDKLIKTRNAEGLRLKEFLQIRVSNLLQLIKDLIGYEQQWVGIYKQKLHKKITDLGIEVDANRLEQEVVLLAEKMDIAEEIYRFQEHLKVFQTVFVDGGIVGRKLDFMLQEMLREINTIGSKINILKISKIVVETKVIMEQMREQVQNIE